MKQKRNNGTNSTGPKTTHGKARSAQNASLHNIFSREVAGNEADRAECIALRAELHRQLKPRGLLQELALDEIVTCIYKKKLALRFYQLQMHALLQPTPTIENTPELPEEPGGPLLLGLQGRSPAALRRGMSLLQDVSGELDSLHRISDVLTAKLEATFGPQVANTIAQWTGRSAALMLADAIVCKAQLYNMPSLETLSPEEDGPYVRHYEDVSQQAQGKMLDLLYHQLAVRLQELEQHASTALEEAAVVRGDLSLRYVTAATRAWERAIKQFFYLQAEQGSEF